MANQRMYLCFRPSGRLRFLGKHMAEGYYMAPPAETLEAFYDKCWDDCCCIDANHSTSDYRQDDFILLFENDSTWNFAVGIGEFAIANTPDNPHNLPLVTPGWITV